jgi:hypothetical protein
MSIFAEGPPMTRYSENPIRPRPLAPSAPPVALPADPGCIFLIRSDSACPQSLAAPERDALAAADAVLHEGDIDPGILALVRRGVFVEPVASVDERAPGRSAAIARAGKLASEGWRVVWIGSDDTACSPADFAAAAGMAIQVCTDACAHRETRSNLGHGPQPLATAFNGLAG